MWPLWFEAHNLRALLPLSSQAPQAPALRWSSCLIRVMAKMKEMGTFYDRS